MKKKTIKNVGMGVFAALMAVGTALTTQAEVADEIRCIEFKGVDFPDVIQVSNKANYNSATLSLLCPEIPVTLCGICIDTEQFPLDENGMPDFTDADLIEILQTYGTDPAYHGSPQSVNGKTATLYFRAEK